MGDLRRLSHHDDRQDERTVRLTDLSHWLFVRGHAADVVIAIMLIEWLWLILACRWPSGATTLRLLPGAMMMLGLRGALVGADWRWIALPLALAFPVHLADLARGRPRRP